MMKAIFWCLAVGGFSTSAATFEVGARVSSAISSGALSTASGNLDADPQHEFVSIASRNSGDPHFRIYKYSVSSSLWSIYNVVPQSTVNAKQDRFGTEIALADFDNDGDKDIATIDSSNSGTPGEMLWFANPGSLGGNWMARSVTVWSGSGGGNEITHSEIAAGDINADGLIDLVARDISHGVWVILQDSPGDGTVWKPRRFIPTNPREGVALADIDKDGDLDIVINGIWLQTPADPLNGTYIQRAYSSLWYPGGASSEQVNDYACQVQTADFDRDGDLDIVITNSEELSNGSTTTSKPSGVRVYLCPPDPLSGVWQEVILHSNHFSWHSCEVGDFDRDGDFDVVSGISAVGADDAAPLIVLFKNNGSGTVFSQEVVGSGTSDYVYQASAGDFDGDGDLDLFMPYNWSSGPIWAYRNLTVGSLPPRRPSAPTGLSAINK